MSDRASASPIVIRTARPNEAAALAAFQEAMAIESEDLVLDPATVAAGVEAVLRQPVHGTYFVAERDGRLLGCLLAVPEWSDWRNGQVLWIHSVYVVPEARKQGVYRRLYTHLQAKVRADPGLHGLRLYVDRRNVAAQKAYERLGMTRDHYHLYEWLEDG